MRTRVSLIALSLFTAASLSAGVVNFAPLATPVSGFVAAGNGATYSQDGLTFTSEPYHVLGVWGTAEQNHPAGGDLATSLTTYSAGDAVSFAATNSSPFSLFSIDLAPWGVNQGTPEETFQFTFTGTVHGGGTVFQDFFIMYTATPHLQTFTFSNSFSNLDSVGFIQGAYDGGTAIQFNNIVTDVDGTPEPSTFGLLIVGGLLVLPRLRKARARL